MSIFPRHTYIYPTIHRNIPLSSQTSGYILKIPLQPAMDSPMSTSDRLIFAVPKGRILSELRSILQKIDLIPEPAFEAPDARQLRFTTNQPDIDIIRVRSFDVATFVAFGAAHLGVAGNDVIAEFDYAELYAPVDLNIGHCRLSVAESGDLSRQDDPAKWSHIRIATKYPELTQQYFAKRGVQSECIKLHGAMELAPSMGLCRRIVDLVSTGNTLRENGLVEVEKIIDVSSRLIVNRTALKTDPDRMASWVEKFREAVNANTP